MSERAKYFLKNKNASGKTAINLYIKSLKLKFGIGYSIKPKYWNQANGEPFSIAELKNIINNIKGFKDSKGEVEKWNQILLEVKNQNFEFENIRTRIRSITKIVRSSIDYIERADYEIDLKEEILTKLNERYRKGKQASNVTFFHFFKEYIESLKSGRKKKKNGKSFSKDTWRTYETHLKKLIQFTEEFSYDTNEKKIYKNLSFRDFDEYFYDDFIFWLENKGYKPNYQGNIIKNLKVVLGYAYKKSMPVNLDYIDFVKPSEESFSIYLEQDEVERLSNLDLTKDPKSYSITRDAFLVGVDGMLSVGDYLRINPNMISEVSNGKTLTLNRKKSDVRCVIPIKPNMDIILKNYNYTIPKITPQTTNRIIKELGERAGISSIVLGLPKYRYIKNHTARRTGATLNYLKGIDITEIMAVGGWKTEEEFRKYLKITKEEFANRLLSNENYMK